MNKTWRWLALGAVAVMVAVAALPWANNTFAGGASPAPSLTNTNWSLVSINGQPPIAGRALTLSFQAGGQLGGDSGCNSFGGQYQINGSKLTVSQMISTMRACAEQPLNDQEAAFQKALGETTQLSLAGNQLTLKNASGGGVLLFQKQ